MGEKAVMENSFIYILTRQLGLEPLIFTPFVAVLGSKKDLMHLKFKLHFKKIQATILAVLRNQIIYMCQI